MTRTSFTYSPTIQGYDESLWKTIYGTPAISGGQLSLSNSQVVHYGSFLRGEATFNLKLPVAPSSMVGLTFGLYSPSENSYAYFVVAADGDLVAASKAGNGTTEKSSDTIAWNSAWTGANVEFTIIWEAGFVKFYIAGVRKAVLSEDSAAEWDATTDATSHIGWLTYIPTEPLHLFISNPTSSAVNVKYVRVENARGYYQAPDVEGAASLDTNVFEWENITVTENITLLIPTLVPTFSESITLTESVTMEMTPLVNLNDAITVTENTVMFIPELVPEVSEAITVAETVTLLIPELVPKVSEAITIVENIALTIV